MRKERIKALGKEMRNFLSFDECRNFSREFIKEIRCASNYYITGKEKKIYNAFILKKGLIIPYGDMVFEDIIWYLGNNKFYYSIHIYDHHSESYLITLNEKGIKRFQEIREEYKELFDE